MNGFLKDEGCYDLKMGIEGRWKVLEGFYAQGLAITLSLIGRRELGDLGKVQRGA